MWYFISFLLLLTFAQFILVLSNKKPHQIKEKFHIDPRTPIFKVSLLIGIVILYGALIGQVIGFHRIQPYIGVAGTTLTGDTPKMYEELGYRDSASVENFYYLYTSSDRSQDALQIAAVERRIAKCKKSCIINFYDERKAYDLDIQRLTIKEKRVMEEWNKNNYVYVADHYLGYQGPSAVDTFAHYPFRDWYYKKLKDKKE